MSENPYEAPRHSGASTLEVDVDLRKDHLHREGRIRVIGILFGLVGLMLVAASVSAVIEIPSPEIGADQIKGAAIMGFAILAFVSTGYGLMKYHKPARIAAFILSIPGLVVFPVGTVFCAFILSVVSDPSYSVIFTQRYRDLVSKTPDLKPKCSRKFKIVFSIVVAATIGGIFFLMELLNASRP